MTHDEAMDLLPAAKAGDQGARARIAMFVFEQYRPRLNRLITDRIEHVLSLRDAEQIFFEAILRHVPKLDGRGDDMYHAGQRGVWAVMSAVRSALAVVKQNVARWDDWQDGDAPDWERRAVREPAAPDPFERAVDRMDAQQRVQVLVTSPLKAPLRRAVDAIVSGDAGDPRDLGFNARLAVAMGVSPQRASQVMAELRKVAA